MFVFVLSSRRKFASKACHHLLALKVAIEVSLLVTSSQWKIEHSDVRGAFDGMRALHTQQALAAIKLKHPFKRQNFSSALGLVADSLIRLVLDHLLDSLSR